MHFPYDFPNNVLFSFIVRIQYIKHVAYNMGQSTVYVISKTPGQQLAINS